MWNKDKKSFSYSTSFIMSTLPSGDIEYSGLSPNRREVVRSGFYKGVVLPTREGQSFTVYDDSGASLYTARSHISPTGKYYWEKARNQVGYTDTDTEEENIPMEVDNNLGLSEESSEEKFVHRTQGTIGEESFTSTETEESFSDDEYTRFLPRTPPQELSGEEDKESSYNARLKRVKSPPRKESSNFTRIPSQTNEGYTTTTALRRNKVISSYQLAVNAVKKMLSDNKVSISPYGRVTIFEFVNVLADYYTSDQQVRNGENPWINLTNGINQGRIWNNKFLISINGGLISPAEYYKISVEQGIITPSKRKKRTRK